MASIKFIAHAENENTTKTIVTARNFKMIVDEPENLGGTNKGANPVEYLLAALAGCLNVVGHLIAKEMGFALNGLVIELEGDLDPAKFMGKSNQNRAGYSNIRVVIKPDTDAGQAVLEEWLKRIEIRCPVSDNISNSTPLEFSLG